MRTIILAFFGLVIVLPVFSQVGNEWIRYDQRYFKIPVAKDGFYRLNYSSLISLGVSASVDPATFQLFHRGVEQAIFVQGEDDGQFNTTDYIVFYGRRNDGTTDAELYASPTQQPHQRYNLFSDTTSYFFTYGSVTGKRMPEFTEANTGLTPQAWHWDEKIMVLSDQYSGGIDYGDIQKTLFDDGEGWTGNIILQNQTANYTIEGITLTVPTADPPQLEILLTGRGPMVHDVELYAGSRLLTTLTFSGYQSYKHKQALQWNDIGTDGKIIIGIKVPGLSGPDRVSVGYIELKYPQKFDMVSFPEKFFILTENASGKSYIEIQNPPAGVQLFDITNPSGVIRIGGLQTSTLNVIIPSTNTSRKIAATTTLATPSIIPVSFRNINPAVHDFIFITHPSLRKPASGYLDPVKAYAEYRALPQGGGFDTLIVNINQLYDQFNYGEQSPLAIFHFLKFLAAVNPPDYLFLIGKGLDIYYKYHRTPGSFSAFKDLVPTAGYPASDLLYTAGLSGDPNAPAIATGRLSAMGPQDVAAYLNKIKETEALPFGDLRRKNILHLSGGIFEGEPQTFRTYLQEFGTVAESFYMGGHVKAIAKQSTDIEVINVADEVNEGVSLITFFGHSAATTTDFDIGFVTDPVMGYSNKGKYPALLMNGCSSGSFFLNQSIFGENWINTPNRGALGVIAHSSFGFAYSLRNYSSLFYDVAFSDPVFIHKGIGDVQKEVARRYLNAYSATPTSITQVQQMVLLGDPSFRIFGAAAADYEINDNNLFLSSLNGAPVTARSDAFKLNIVIRNFGKAIDQNFKIQVVRTLADNSTLAYDSVFNPVLYSDTISFILPGKIVNGSGNNQFSIYIDAENIIDELREDNNNASFQYFIPLSGTKNLFPDNFSIVNTREINLTLQHTDLLSQESEFMVELDTTDSFDSGFKQEFKIKGSVLALQQVTLLDADTLAYYWRSKLVNPAGTDSVVWDVSSFTYIQNGPEGWAQVHFPQYLSNSSVGLVKDPELSSLRFEETTIDVALKAFGSASGKPQDSTSLKINGAEYNIYSGGAGCRNNTINLVAFDKKTTQPYPGIYFTWYDILYSYGGRRLICGREPYVINSFLPGELTMGNNADLDQYVNNIPAGDSVVLFNIGDAGYGSWPLSAKTKLGELGISVVQIDNLQPGEPVVIFGKKGANPGTATIYRSSSIPINEQNVAVKRTITGRTTSGSMTSQVIGPARHWDQFLIQYSSVETSDAAYFDVIGIKENGEQELLKTNLISNEDLTDIDAAIYPFLKVSFKPADHILLTPAQLDEWLVTFEPVAEGILLYKSSPDQEIVYEGQTWTGEYSFLNISSKPFGDSLMVKYEISNPDTYASTEQFMRIKDPPPGDTTTFTVSFPTLFHQGLNNLEVFVNPRIIPEQTFDNNAISLNAKLNVLTDNQAPVLDVTVDGRHLMNNDFVSSNPEIKIALWDNNPYLLKTDTTGFLIFLAYPCENFPCAFQAIYFSSESVAWQAETDTSEFKVTFKPQDLVDGDYALRVVGRDGSGNASALEPYSITFRVKNGITTSIFPPYPNPFNYKTNFEFLVTGDEVPTGVTLQIISPNGKIVQNFSETDSDQFHIGTNTVAWSGQDMDGNSLPNGIYFYRLTLRIQDNQISTNGKLVLTR